jgi:hypothetical protein
LFVAGGGAEGAFVVLLRPLDPEAPRASVGEETSADAGGSKDVHKDRKDTAREEEEDAEEVDSKQGKDKTGGSSGSSTHGTARAEKEEKDRKGTGETAPGDGGGKGGGAGSKGVSKGAGKGAAGVEGGAEKADLMSLLKGKALAHRLRRRLLAADAPGLAETSAQGQEVPRWHARAPARAGHAAAARASRLARLLLSTKDDEDAEEEEEAPKGVAGGGAAGGGCNVAAASLDFSSSNQECASYHGASLVRELPSAGRVLVIGSELSLLALKLAAQLPDSIFVAVHDTAAAAERTRDIARVMRVENVFVCQRTLSLWLLEELSGVPEPYDVTILGTNSEKYSPLRLYTASFRGH